MLRERFVMLALLLIVPPLIVGCGHTAPAEKSAADIEKSRQEHITRSQAERGQVEAP
jgi:hypothetical protein